MPSTKQIKKIKMDKLDQIMTNFMGNFRNVYREAKKQGFWGILKFFWRDLFAGQTTFQWIHLLLLSSVPFFSIYLWWNEIIHIQGMYWVHTVNSLLGWYQWTKALKKEVA